jgi:hemerythrin superfamily protein
VPAAAVTRSSTMVRTSTIQPPSRSSAQDALELLRNDHRQINELLSLYARTQETMEVAKKTTLVARLCRAVAVHTAIEEELFYPAIRETVVDAGPLLDIAEIQHDAIKRLTKDLAASTPSVDPRYDAKVAVLDGYFKDHVRLEEEQLFPKIHKTALELFALGEQLALRRREALAAIGNTEAQS